MTEKKQYGLQVLGTIRVFRKDKEYTDKRTKKAFTITDTWFNVSEKEEDGSYFNKSMKLLFKRGLDLPENNTVIELAGFPVISGNGDYRQISFMVTGWSEVE